MFSQLFVQMAWSFSKTFKSLAKSCYRKHDPVIFTMLNNFFVWMLCSLLKTFKLMAGHAPSIPCHGPAHFAELNISLFWCYTDFQQRSIERLVVLPQIRSSSYHGVESTFRPDGMKHFKNIWKFGWVVFFQTRPKPIHGVAKTFRLDVMQPFKKLSSWWLGRALQPPMSRPS